MRIARSAAGPTRDHGTGEWSLCADFPPAGLDWSAPNQSQRQIIIQYWIGRPADRQLDAGRSGELAGAPSRLTPSAQATRHNATTNHDRSAIN